MFCMKTKNKNSLNKNSLNKKFLNKNSFKKSSFDEQSGTDSGRSFLASEVCIEELSFSRVQKKYFRKNIFFVHKFIFIACLVLGMDFANAGFQRYSFL